MEMNSVSNGAVPRPLPCMQAYCTCMQCPLLLRSTIYYLCTTKELGSVEYSGAGAGAGTSGMELPLRVVESAEIALPWLWLIACVLFRKVQ